MASLVLRNHKFNIGITAMHKFLFKLYIIYCQ